MQENPTLSQAELLQKFFRRYPVLRPTRAVEPHLLNMTIQAFQKHDFDYHKPTLFFSPYDLSKVCFSLALSKMGYSYSFYTLSLGQLLDIWLGNNEDCHSFADVRSHVVGLYWGYGDLPNKESGTIIENAVSIANLKGLLKRRERFGVTEIYGQALWLYFRGSGQELLTRFPKLLPFLQNSDFQIMPLGTSLSGWGEVSMPGSSYEESALSFGGSLPVSAPPSISENHLF